MQTNKTIGLNMSLSDAKELERRAKSMELATGTYCKRILKDWVASGKKLTIKE